MQSHIFKQDNGRCYLTKKKVNSNNIIINLNQGRLEALDYSSKRQILLDLKAAAVEAGILQKSQTAGFYQQLYAEVRKLKQVTWWLKLFTQTDFTIDPFTATFKVQICSQSEKNSAVRLNIIQILCRKKKHQHMLRTSVLYFPRFAEKYGTI